MELAWSWRAVDIVLGSWSCEHFLAVYHDSLTSLNCCYPRLQHVVLPACHRTGFHSRRGAHNFESFFASGWRVVWYPYAETALYRSLVLLYYHM